MLSYEGFTVILHVSSESVILKLSFGGIDVLILCTCETLPGIEESNLI